MAARRWNLSVGRPVPSRAWLRRWLQAWSRPFSRLRDPRERTAGIIALALVGVGGLSTVLGLSAAVLVGPGSNYSAHRTLQPNTVQPNTATVVLTSGVVGAVGPEITVSVRRVDGGSVFVGRAISGDVTDLTKGVPQLGVTGVRPMHRLVIRPTPGAAAAATVQSSDIWRDLTVGTGERSLTWRPDQARESVLIASTDGSALPGLRLRVTWHRSGWFPAAVLVTLIGLALLLAGLHSVTGGHLLRRVTNAGLDRISRIPLPARGGRPPAASGGRRARVTATVGVVVALLSGCSAAGGLVGVHSAPATPASGPALEPQQARAIVGRVLTDANQADAARDTTAAARAYDGLALQMAAALYQVDTSTGVRVPARPSSPQRPEVLLTRGTAYPRFFFTVLAGTKSQPPVVSVLTAPNASSAYRIVGSVSLLLGARLPAVADVSDGSAVLPPDATGLALSPEQVGPSYAGLLNLGSSAPLAAKFASDSFVQQVQQAAAAQRAEVARFGTYTQTHEAVPAATVAIRTSNGGALVFAALQRTSTFTGRVGNVATLPSDVRVLTGEVEASMFTSTAAELLLFTVPPAGKGRVHLIAASDGLIAATAQ